MTRPVQDRYLPPDHDAFVAADPPTGRVIVIAPTRAACETIELALGLHIETYLERTHGGRVRELAASGKGFGIVAGTGTGKTLAIRPIAETILQAPLRVGVVNREREATPETPTWNVIIVTTGIARRWFQDGDILPADTLVVDEIHQTSAELELCLALGKRVGCRYIWLSATVDPTFYRNYLGSADVLEVYSFDPSKAADVRVVRKQPLEFLDDKFLQQVTRQRRGVGMFLPTRAGVEQAAGLVGERFPRINSAYYHGGEPIRVLRPFLEGEERKPYFLSMTAAGQSALNVQGLDTVVIDDSRFTNIIERGKNVLTKLHLGANEILQMAGRVHGRVEGGRVFILSDRDIDFGALRPTEPEFQLAGDSERVALTCADLGVRADELELPVPLDRVAYRRALAFLEGRGIIEHGRLSQYGKAVEALPVDRAWAELIVNADDELVPYLAVMSSIESLHRMTREERDLDGLLVPGSDHLTAYNLYAEAYTQCGYVGEVYGLPRHLFDESIERWAERRGVLVKAIEDAALATASVYRGVGLELPTKLTPARDHVHRKFADLLARYMPFDLVIDEETAWGEEARVSKTSVCGSWGAIAGTLRYFADRFGIPRASIEGTQIPADLLRRYARRGEAELVYDPQRKQAPLVLRRRLEYFGFTLERETEPLHEFPPELAPQARRVLAESLARFEARHPAVKRNRAAVEEIRELYRRSGGTTGRLGFAELTALYEEQLAGVTSVDDFRNVAVRVDRDRFVSPEERERLWALPTHVELRGRQVEIDYDVEEVEGRPVAVARLRLPEKLARSLTEAELPELDRPLRFVVLRGQRGALRAQSLDELQEALERPWSPDELRDDTRGRDDDALTPRAERQVKEIASALRRERDASRGRQSRGRSRPSGGRRDGGRDGGREGGGRDGARGGSAPGGAKFGRGGRRKRGR
jgi:ATP-dependent helicase HrpA